MDGPFDLVVGADGGSSKVRAILTDVKPGYSGVSGFEAQIWEPGKRCPSVERMVGKGSYFGSGNRKMLNAQRMGDGNLKVRSWFLCPEGEARETLEKSGKQGTMKKILEKYDGWAPEIIELFKMADVQSLRHWTCHELPVGFKWKHRPRFTLIGDAASLATPFSGQGVNKAMQDALELAELIEKSQDPHGDLTLDQAVGRYEQLMFLRTKKLQVTTMNNKETMFGPDGPIGLVPRMLQTMAHDSPSMLIKVAGSAPVVALAYGYFWIRSQIGLAVRRLWRRT